MSNTSEVKILWDGEHLLMQLRGSLPLALVHLGLSKMCNDILNDKLQRQDGVSSTLVPRKVA